MKKQFLSFIFLILLIMSVTVGCALNNLTEVNRPDTVPQVTDSTEKSVIDPNDGQNSGTDNSNVSDDHVADISEEQQSDDSGNNSNSENLTTDAQASDDSVSDDPSYDESASDDQSSEDGSEQELPDEDGSYTKKDDVALYLHTYGKLPGNFITKKEANALGWEGGSLEPYAPGKCIGGDRFGNYEGNLPTGKNYHECDIDTLGQRSRGAKRIVYSDDGYIYYTEDHYESFELLYGE